MMADYTPRTTFDRQIQEIQNEVLILGSMVEEAVLEAVEALKQRDLEAAERIYHGDQKINEKRYEIENECLVLIARQQPMARDLRILAAVLEINTELERIGDYAKGISRINMMMGDEPFLIPITDLSLMAEKGLDMLHRSLSAFIERDAKTARQIPVEDDEIDALYNHIYRELIDQMIADPETIDRANYLVWAAHNLERMADRVTNICERIVFVVSGEMMELDVSDDETYERKYQS
jgi:phosphate transport system protein